MKWNNTLRAMRYAKARLNCLRWGISTGMAMKIMFVLNRHAKKSPWKRQFYYYKHRAMAKAYRMGIVTRLTWHDQVMWCRRCGGEGCRACWGSGKYDTIKLLGVEVSTGFRTYRFHQPFYVEEGIQPAGKDIPYGGMYKPEYGLSSHCLDGGDLPPDLVILYITYLSLWLGDPIPVSLVSGLKMDLWSLLHCNLTFRARRSARRFVTKQATALKRVKSLLYGSRRDVEEIFNEDEIPF